MYGQPHQGYGMSPQTSYEHSSSPANLAGFGQPSLQGRDSSVSGGLGEYGRSGSTQPSQAQQHSGNSGAFGGMADVFGRGSYPAQTQQQGSQQGSSEENLKPYGDSKSTGGPSP